MTAEELGGATTHSTKSGVAHFTYANEIELINNLKRLLSYMPQNCEEDAPALAYESGDETRAALDEIIPENPNQPYDIREVIDGTIDEGSFMKCIRIMPKTLCVDLHD